MRELPRLDLQREIQAELGGSGAQPVLLRVGAIESVLHSWLMDWVRALREQLKPPQLVEAIGVAAMANALCRMAAVVQAADA